MRRTWSAPNVAKKQAGILLGHISHENSILQTTQFRTTLKGKKAGIEAPGHLELRDTCTHRPQVSGRSPALVVRCRHLCERPAASAPGQRPLAAGPPICPPFGGGCLWFLFWLHDAQSTGVRRAPEAQVMFERDLHSNAMLLAANVRFMTVTSGQRSILQYRSMSYR